MQIADGKGTGKKAQVTSEYKIGADAVVKRATAHVSLEYGDAYTIMGEAAEANATQQILYIQNQDPDKLLVVETIDLECVDLAASAAATVYMDVVFDLLWTADGTAVTAVNLNRTSTLLPLIAAYDTDPTLGAGAVTGPIIKWLPESADPVPQRYELFGSVILGYDDAITVRLISTGATGTGKALVTFYMLEPLE